MNGLSSSLLLLFQSGGGDVKLRAAERPQSLNIARSSGSSHVSPSHSVVAPRQVTHADRLGCDIVEQSLRAANVLADFSAAEAGCPPMQPRTVATSLSLACTATSSLAASVTHPLASAGDCVLDYSQQQRVNRRRHSDLVYGPRHSLSDIVTPTSDVTASSPSETLSQVDLSVLLCLRVPAGGDGGRGRGWGLES